MQPRTWLSITIAFTLIAGAAIALINVAADPYGLYRDTHARRLAVYGDARVAKYLLSWRYVPENFNAVLIGGSFSANWDVRRITHHLRVYNESLNGGNIVEEKAIAEAVVSEAGISTALLTVHPALTASHDFMTIRLAPNLRFSSLGSLSLWFAYKDMFYVRMGHSAQGYDETGIEDFGTMRSDMPPNMKKYWAGGDYFYIDPIALASYRALIASLRSHNIRIVFIIPPTYEGVLRTKQSSFEAYVELIRGYSNDRDQWIDFRSEEYSGFRSVRSNFPDGVHLSPNAAGQVVSYIDAKLKDWEPEDAGFSRTTN